MNSTEPVAAIERTTAYVGLTMACAPSEAKRRLQELQAFVQTNMERNVDYGIIPGTDKPSLYQPGAQKLAEIYGFGHRFQVVEQVKDWERGFFYFEYKCQLFLRRDGQDVGEGIGSCNSKESKYGDRWVFDSDIPKGLDKGSLKTKEITSKKNGRAYIMFSIPNPDPYSLVNTLQKMAAKRAYIHAVISATRSSGILTQDVEDLPPEAFGSPDAARSWEQEQEPRAASGLEEKIASARTTPQRDFVAEANEIKQALASAIQANDSLRISTIRDRYLKLRDAWPTAIVQDVRRFYESISKTAVGSAGPDLPKQPAAKRTQPLPSCMICRKPISGKSIETTDGDGVVGQRHPGCSPFGVVEDGGSDDPDEGP